MPSKGQSGIATYLAWNTSTNVYETGDAANHTIYFARDGIFSGAQNQTAITELSSAVGAAKGAYQIAWTSAEGTCNVLWVGGNSSTANVALIPITYTFEQLPIAVPNANNGLITVGSGAGQLTMQSGFANATVSQWLGVPPNALQSGLVQVAVLSGLVNANVTAWLGVAPAPLSTVQSGYVQATATVVGITSQAQFGVNVVTWEGAVPAPLVNALVQTTVSGSIASSTNVTQWGGVNVAPLIGGLVQATVSGVANANVQQWLGVAPNALQNGLVQSSHLSGLSLANVTQINGAAVNTATAQLGVNLVNILGTPSSGAPGYVGIDWSKIANQSAPNFFSGTSIGEVIASVGSVIAAVTVSGIVNSNVTQWEGAIPAPLIGGLVQTTGSGLSNVNVTQWQGSSPNVLTGSGNLQVDVEQWRSVIVNTLQSGRVDATVGQIQTNAIGTSAFVAGALTATVFGAPFLTSASYDTTYSNGLADALGNRTNAIETGLTPYQSWRLVASSQGGQLSGAGTTQIGIWGAGVTATRISSIVDGSGNRQSVVLTL